MARLIAEAANNSKLLAQIQRFWWASITGTMSTTITTALETILNLQLIHLEVKRKATNNPYKLEMAQIGSQ